MRSKLIRCSPTVYPRLYEFVIMTELPRAVMETASDMTFALVIDVTRLERACARTIQLANPMQVTDREPTSATISRFSRRYSLGLGILLLRGQLVEHDASFPACVRDPPPGAPRRIFFSSFSFAAGIVRTRTKNSKNYKLVAFVSLLPIIHWSHLESGYSQNISIFPYSHRARRIWKYGIWKYASV